MNEKPEQDKGDMYILLDLMCQMLQHLEKLQLAVNKTATSQTFVMSHGDDVACGRMGLGKQKRQSESLLGFRGVALGLSKGTRGRLASPPASVTENLGCSKENAEQRLGLSGFIDAMGICVGDNGFTVDSRLIFS